MPGLLVGLVETFAAFVLITGLFPFFYLFFFVIPFLKKFLT